MAPVSDGSFDPDFWQRTQDLFAAAVDLPEAERETFLKTACDGNETIRHEVESLLSAHPASEEELEQSPVRHDSLDVRMDSIDIPGYEILEELNRGGQGVVYRALQVSTKREVALKVLLRGPFADHATKLRFAREVELVGRLRHPGIVPVFDSGETHGQSFYAMEFVRGENLRDYAQTHELSQEDKLQLYVRICAAIGYAHQQGVIHRDVKPSNVLIDSSGRPSVVDFGLAKIGNTGAHNLDQHAAALSITGQIMGTLSYMSPEQASGEQQATDTRSDVYSLGVMLYELLWNELPYNLDNTLIENLNTIQNVEPKKRRGRHADGELDTIIRKAMSKEKSRRYSNAEALGEDIERYLHGAPVEAKRDSSFYVLRKTLRRHFVLATSAAAFVVLLLVSSIVAWGLYLRAEDSRQNESILSARYQSERNRAETLRQQSQHQLYRAEMNLAGQALRENTGIGRVEELTQKWSPKHDEDEAFRGWEWYYLKSQCDQEIASFDFDGKVWSVALSPDQRQLAVGGSPRNALVHPMPFGTPNESKELAGHFQTPVRALGFSCNSESIAFATGISKGYLIVDAASNKHVWSFRHNANTLALAWHPTEQSLLATTSIDGIVKIVDVEKRSVQHRFEATQGCHTAEWSPNGRFLAVGCWGKLIILWDNENQEVIQRWETARPVYDLAWSNDGNQIVTVASSGEIEFRSAREDKIIWQRKAKQPLWNVVWHPDGTKFATAGEGRTVQVWTTSGRLVRTIRGHTAPIWGAAWCNNGEQLVTGSHDGTCRFWEVGSPLMDKVFVVPEHEQTSLTEVQFSPDGRELIVAGEMHDAFVLNADNGQIRLRLPGAPHNESAAWSPDGSRIVIGGGLTATVWNAKTGELITRFEKHVKASNGYNLVLDTVWTPDGKNILSSAHFGPLFVWDAETGELKNTLRHKDVLPHSVRWRGDTLAVAALSGAFLMDSSTGSRQPLQGIHAAGQSVAWSPDGTKLAVGSGTSGKIAIHGSDGELLCMLPGHVGRLLWVIWHPDGTRLATCSADETIRIWDTQAAAQTLVLHGHDHAINCVDWSPDGKRLVSVGRDGRIITWDASRGYAINK